MCVCVGPHADAAGQLDVERDGMDAQGGPLHVVEGQGVRAPRHSHTSILSTHLGHNAARESLRRVCAHQTIGRWRWQRRWGWCRGWRGGCRGRRRTIVVQACMEGPPAALDEPLHVGGEVVLGVLHDERIVPLRERRAVVEPIFHRKGVHIRDGAVAAQKVELTLQHGTQTGHLELVTDVSLEQRNGGDVEGDDVTEGPAERLGGDQRPRPDIVPMRERHGREGRCFLARLCCLRIRLDCGHGNDADLYRHLRARRQFRANEADPVFHPQAVRARGQGRRKRTVGVDGRMEGRASRIDFCDVHARGQSIIGQFWYRHAHDRRLG
eukprot:PhM_4_TR18079/c1_g1_i1/m.44830